MQIIEIELNKLKDYENNPRNNDGAVEAVANSINEFGFKVPIIVDQNNVIVCGHTRKKASEKLGLSKVPCIIADDLNADQIKALRLADNKTAELAEWDFNKLNKEIEELINIDLTNFGFELEEISADAFDTDFELPNEDKPQSRTITLTLAEEQYQICEGAIDYFKDKIEHDYGNHNKRSNALFEAVYLWAKQNE